MLALMVPFSLTRESVVLKNLTDCSVYLLDYSGEVEVSNVTNSQIFIGMPLIYHLNKLPHRFRCMTQANDAKAILNTQTCRYNSGCV